MGSSPKTLGLACLRCPSYTEGPRSFNENESLTLSPFVLHWVMLSQKSQAWELAQQEGHYCQGGQGKSFQKPFGVKGSPTTIPEAEPPTKATQLTPQSDQKYIP